MAAVAFHCDYRSPHSYMAMTQLGDIDLALLPFDVIDVMKRVGNDRIDFMRQTVRA